MAQNKMVCQFCEMSTNIKWKCINCDLILCEECNIKIHSKVKMLKEHNIIDLKVFNSTSAVETIRSLDLKNIQCTNHTDQKYEIYCQGCNMLLCSSCVIDSLSNHTNHRFEKIADVYQRKLKELKEIQGKLDQSMKLFTETETELDTILTKGTKQYNDIKKEILERETEIKNAATKKSEDKVKELDKLWKPEKDEIAQKLGEIREKKGVLNKEMSRIEETLLSEKAMSVLRATDTTTKDLPTLPAKTESSVTKIILSRSTPIDPILNLGSLRKIPEQKVTQSYQVDLSSISRIITTEQGTGLFCSFFDRIIIVCKLQLKDSKCLTTAVIKNIVVTDMAITKQGKLLFSTNDCSEVKYLKKLLPDTTVETFTSVSPLRVSAIHATDKNILIGFCDEGSTSTLTHSSRRGIIIQDYNGRHIRTLECDINNDRIFSYVRKITTNINSDMCVIDRESNTLEGKVVVLAWLGSVKWTYNGHPSINSQHKFTPTDLVTTDEGFILVTDNYSSAIHMLSIDGDLLTCLTVKHGIVLPESLNIDKSGKLLVGCRDPGKTAKLNIVQKIN